MPNGQTPVFLAPMAGVTDAPFRALCVSCGAAGTVSEMVSAKAVSLGDATSLSLAKRRGVGGHYTVQIFASDPVVAAEAVKRLGEVCPDIDGFDLNGGCPAPKIVNNGCGSALMKSPSLLFDILSAMEKATRLPVSVKLRAGFDSDHVNAVDCARAAGEAGVKSITVHGRTRDKMYAPPVDLSVIAAVKEAVKVPVFGNGDIFTPDDAAAMLKETHCDGLMLGRGALGRPWIFTQVNAFLTSGERLPDPSAEEKMAFMLRHIEALAEEEGEKAAILKARKHAAWYTKGIRGAAALRREMNTLSSFDELRAFASRVSALPADADTAFLPPQVGNFTKM